MTPKWLEIQKRKIREASGHEFLSGAKMGGVAGLSSKTDADSPLSISPNFAYASQIGSVRSVTFKGRMLVTGSVDDTIMYSTSCVGRSDEVNVGS